MKMKMIFKGTATIVIIIAVIGFFVRSKASVDNDSFSEFSPLYNQSLKSSVYELENRGKQLKPDSIPYSISGRIDSLNSGNGLKGIVVVLTRITTKSQREVLATTGYSCGATCNYSCGATCQSTCAGKSTCAGGSTCAGSSTCAGGSTCAGSATCAGGSTCVGSSTCYSSATCMGSYTCAGSSTCNSTCAGKATCVGSNTCAGSSTCLSGSTCAGSSTCIGSTTCSSSTYCGSNCPTINTTTCSGSTYCGTACPTVNGNTCSGSTYCGTTCPTINQVTCYTTCNTQTCFLQPGIMYDTTDVNGNYSFTGLTAGDYIVTPSDSIYLIIPDNRTVTLIDSDVSGINFSNVFNSSTSVHETEQMHFDIIKIFPNPFSNSTTISYELYETANININIFDIDGKLVERLISKRQIAGKYNAKWEPLNCNSGVYIVDLMAGKSRLTKQIIYKK